FQNARELPEGKEGEQDLAALFITLGFDVKIHKNLTADEIVQKAEFYGRKKHKGAFFLIILSHGIVIDRRAAVVGTDFKQVTIHKLQTFFNATACPSLRGVPKIFLTSASQMNQKGSTEPTGSAATEFMIVHVHIDASTQRKQEPTHQDQSSTCTLAQAFVQATNEASPSTPFTEVIERVKATVEESNSDQVVKTVDTLSQTCDYFIKRYVHFLCIYKFHYQLSFFI
ncbi:MAG: caspase family protein, partial [Proteobacteria bacterium]|nr:caspase family protein [Pseudomonadota bacterium]